MPSLRPVFLIVGLVLLVLAVAMTVPVWLAAIEHDSGWSSHAATVLVPAFIGAVCVIGARTAGSKFGLREAYLLTSTVWLIVPLVGALPFLWVDPTLPFADAIFESVSGLTTTGSTVITGLNTLPDSFLLWRSILQWLGGIGIIVMAIAILPLLKIGGMQLMQRESSDTSEKILARPRDIAAGLLGVYVGLTVACAIVLKLLGMSGFDAINHAMTTISTGGFSTHDTPMGHFDAGLQWAVLIFMLAGAMPFLLFVRWITGVRGYVPAGQVPVMLAVVAIGGGLMALSAWQSDQPAGDAIRHGLFNVASIITTTGFASTDYQEWGPFAWGIALVLTICGGCTGSTSGGVKIFRWQILFQEIQMTIKEMPRPHRVLARRYDGRPIDGQVASGVLVFVVLVGLVSILGMLALAATGLDLMTALSASVTAITNVGPALGPIAGPSGTFESFSDPAKYIMVVLMLLGRLELLTVLVLFDPDFWRS